MTEEPEIHALAGYSLAALPGPFVVLSTGARAENAPHPDAHAIYRLGMTPKQARDLARDLAKVAADAEAMRKG